VNLRKDQKGLTWVGRPASHRLLKSAVLPARECGHSSRNLVRPTGHPLRPARQCLPIPLGRGYKSKPPSYSLIVDASAYWSKKDTAKCATPCKLQTRINGCPNTNNPSQTPVLDGTTFKCQLLVVLLTDPGHLSRCARTCRQDLLF